MIGVSSWIAFQRCADGFACMVFGRISVTRQLACTYKHNVAKHPCLVRASVKNIPPLGTWCTHRCLRVMLAVMSWRHCQRLHQGTLSMKLQMPIVLHRRRKLLCHGVHSPHWTQNTHPCSMKLLFLMLQVPPALQAQQQRNSHGNNHHTRQQERGGERVVTKWVQSKKCAARQCGPFLVKDAKRRLSFSLGSPMV